VADGDLIIAASRLLEVVGGILERLAEMAKLGVTAGFRSACCRR
jgi:hypothetical protein